MQSQDHQDLKRQIDQIRQLSEENHEMLQKVHGMLWRSRLFRALYWIILIGIAIGAFYFLEPYVEQLTEIYSGLQGQLDAVSSFGGSS